MEHDPNKNIGSAIGLIIMISLVMAAVETNPGPGDNTKVLTEIKQQMDVMCKQLQALNPIRTDLEAIKGDVRAVQTSMAQLTEQQKNLENQVMNLSEENKQLREEINLMKARQVDSEDRSRRKNLLFYGVPEKPDGFETWSDSEEILKETLQTHMDISVLPEDVERCHRLNVNITPKPIICGMTSFKKKEEILSKRNKLKNTDINIQEDYSRETRETRKKLIPFMVEARKKNMQASISYKTLKIGRDRYVYDGVHDKVINVKTKDQLTIETIAEEPSIRRNPARDARSFNIKSYFNSNK